MDPQDRLNSQEVLLWTLRPEDLPPEEALHRFGHLLSAEEHERRERYAFETGRHVHLLARALARVVLASLAGHSPETLRFNVDSFGKPELAPTPDCGGLRFNLSHTAGLLALVVARKRRVGVDVERVEEHRDHLAISLRSFAAPEHAALMALPVPQQVERFFALWTLKEAYLKARGEGLTLPLDSVSFELTGDALTRVTFEPSLQDDPSRWFFRCLPIQSSHAVALAVEREPGERITIRGEDPLPLLFAASLQ